ncbi:tRNA(Met) cytidine acetyltransferase TmcA domain-containing protein, partial [Haladaptatus sp.]|uniref:tRNA(Met) cytidine acetyltransferase TmcA domain-containing protein n=1 Tax=Haladaptatus sp. TaxID=1973141 RepID=UPI003C375DFC
MNVSSLVAALHNEARESNERRLLVLAGDREEGYEVAQDALAAAKIPEGKTAQVAPRRVLDCEQVSQNRAGNLLGTTHEAVVFDAHDGLRPNALGRVVGAVDGGGLFVLLTPPLDSWPTRRDDFDATLAVPPYSVDDVSGNFRRRFVSLLRAHRGIAIVDVDSESVEDDGLTNPAPRLADRETERTFSGEDEIFPTAAIESCLTDDQASAVHAFDALSEPDNAVVVEADRGRGKSSAAGIAAGCFAADGEDVLVTARSYRSAREVFVRAAA